jgi:hypothetical protein
MARGRKPKPLALRVIEGNRSHTAIPVDTLSVEAPLGSAPRNWLPEMKAVWDEIADETIPGLLTKVDRPAFALLVRLIHESREEPKLTAQLANTIRNCLTEFGMTPAARARMLIPPRLAPSKFAKVASR